MCQCGVVPIIFPMLYFYTYISLEYSPLYIFIHNIPTVIYTNVKTRMPLPITIMFYNLLFKLQYNIGFIYNQQ